MLELVSNNMVKTSDAYQKSKGRPKKEKTEPKKVNSVPPVKRGKGRPKKETIEPENVDLVSPVKRGKGRPAGKRVCILDPWIKSFRPLTYQCQRRRQSKKAEAALPRSCLKKSSLKKKSLKKSSPKKSLKTVASTLGWYSIIHWHWWNSCSGRRREHDGSYDAFTVRTGASIATFTTFCNQTNIVSLQDASYHRNPARRQPRGAWTISLNQGIKTWQT